jgi:hypothetical protein
LKVRSGEPPSLDKGNNMGMAVIGVVVMEGRDKLDVAAEALFEFDHSVDSYVFNTQVFKPVLASGVRGYDEAVKDRASWGIINHLVCLLFG